jgi:FkbM family methyltransferase
MKAYPIMIHSIPFIWYSARLVPSWLPGRTRLTRALFKVLTSKQNRNEICFKIRANGLSFFAPSLREPVATSLILDGCYEPKIRKIIEKFLPPGGVLVDVGANIGSHSFWASKLAGDGGQVISVEASPYIFECLQLGISANQLSNMHAYNLIAGEMADGVCEFYDSPRDKFGMGSRSSERFGGVDKSYMPMATLDSLFG